MTHKVWLVKTYSHLTGVTEISRAFFSQTEARAWASQIMDELTLVSLDSIFVRGKPEDGEVKPFIVSENADGSLTSVPNPEAREANG